jgi:hypothetical protein
VHIKTTHAQSLVPRRSERLISLAIQLTVQKVVAEQCANDGADDPTDEASDEAAATPAFACFYEQFLRRTNVRHVPLPFVFSRVAFIHVSSLCPQVLGAIAIA